MTDTASGSIDFDGLFASIDAMDAEGFVAFIATDATFRFGSSPPVNGRPAIRQSVESFFSMFAGLRHELQRVIVDGGTAVCEGEVTYTKHDGSKITLPFANIFEIKAGLISIYRIYIDMGPVFAE